MLNIGYILSITRRYQRLKMELNEFSEDLKKLSEESEDNSNTVKLAGEVIKFREKLMLVTR